MAENKKPTAEELQAELDALKTENQELRKKTKKNDNTGVVIRGNVEVQLETPDGKKEKKKMKYVPGFIRTRLSDGRVVESQALLDLANGKKLTEQQLFDNPQLADMTKEQAMGMYTQWVQKKVAFLEEV